MSGCNSSGYTVKRLLATCTECSSLKDDFRICRERQCDFLCPHMYSCDSKCYDYSNNHMCKHIHRVHSLFHQNMPTTSSVPKIIIDGPDDNINYVDSMFDPNRGNFISDSCVNVDYTLDKTCRSHHSI